MKKQVICAWALSALMLPATMLAKETPITPASFATAWSEAADGDVLVMEAGKYEAEILLQSNKTITLRAAADAEVILQQGPTAEETTENVGLILDGITVHLRRGDHFMRFCNQSVKTLEFRNCIIEEVPRCFFNATGNIQIEQIIFDNCIIRECGTKGYCFIWSKASIKKLSVTNCTLYNYLDGESFLLQSGRRANCNIEVIFENNTISKWGIGDGDTQPFLDVTGNFGREATYTFRNNIFSESSISANRPNIITVSGGTVTAENNLVIGFGDYNTTENATKTVSDLSADELKLTDGVGFPNAMGGDFTLPEKSPLRKAVAGKKPVGDPRWAK